MKDRLHVLIVPTWYPNGRDKLIGIYHKTFAKALADSGKADVNMLYIDRWGISMAHKYVSAEKYVEEKCDGYSVYMKKILDISKFGFDFQIKTYTRAFEKLFKRYVKTHGMPDVIHAHVFLSAGYAAAYVGKKYNIPVVMTEHSSNFMAYFTGKQEKYSRFVGQNASVNCVSQYMVPILKEKYAIDSDVLPNVVDTSLFHGMPEKRENDSVFRLVTVAGLRIPKRIDILLRALKILKDSGEIGRFKHTIVGDGDMEAIYKNLCHELGLDDCVEFVGRKTPAEAAKILSQNDTLVISSHIETFGIPAIEALAAGLPVVCTKCKGPEGFLDEKCAEFCETDDPEDLARAIKRMYERKGSFDVEYLHSVADKFGFEAIADTALSLYTKAIENN